MNMIVRCPGCGRTSRDKLVLRQKPIVLSLWYGEINKKWRVPTCDTVYMCEACDLEYYGDGKLTYETRDCVSEMK